jgi:hypothetical protein
MYALVFVQPRYVSPIFVLLLGLFAGIRLTDTRQSRRFVACVISVMVAMFLMAVGRATVKMAYATAQDVMARRDVAPHVSWQMAEALGRMGITCGDTVVSVGYANDPPAGWARLARVKIIAEIYSEAYSGAGRDFWTADDAGRHRAIAAFAKAGAKAVVVWEPPSWAPTNGWQPVGDTGYYVYFIPRQTTRLFPGMEVLPQPGAGTDVPAGVRLADHRRADSPDTVSQKRLRMAS